MNGCGGFAEEVVFAVARDADDLGGELVTKEPEALAHRILVGPELPAPWSR